MAKEKKIVIIIIINCHNGLGKPVKLFRSQMTKRTSLLDSSCKIVTQEIFVEFRDNRIFHDFRGNVFIVTPRDAIFRRISGVRK